MAFNISELFSDPSRMAMLTGGLGMMAAARGGNTDLSKGGLGYGLMQGLQGGAQGYQMAKGFQAQDAAQQEAEQKKRAMDDMLMMLNLSPAAMNSQGVMRPGIQQGAQAFQNIPPERRQMAAMALQMGDVGAAMKAMSLDGDSGANKLQFGGQNVFKDNADNLFYGTSVRDPQSGELKTSFSSITPGAGKPDGKLQMVGDYGLTASEQITQRGNLKNTENLQGGRGTNAAEFENLADSWDINKAFILDSVPGMKDLMDQAPGSSLSHVTQGFLSKAVGNTEGADAQALLEQYGAIFMQGMPFAPGSQSDKEQEQRMRIIANQISNPNISKNAKINAITTFVKWQESKAEGQRKKVGQLTGSKSNVIQAEPKKTGIPSGVPADVWNVMTSEERAAWQ